MVLDYERVFIIHKFKVKRDISINHNHLLSVELVKNIMLKHIKQFKENTNILLRSQVVSFTEVHTY